MCPKVNISSSDSQVVNKQISLYSFQAGVCSEVIASLAFSTHEKTLGLLIEDLCHGAESMITQEQIGNLVGIGRQRQNEVCISLRKLGLLDWHLGPTGINVYSLPPIYKNIKVLKILRSLLPRLKRSMDKLITSLSTKLSTHEATPIKIEVNSLSSCRIFKTGREVLKEEEIQKSEKGENVNATAEKKQDLSKLTPKDIEKLKKLSACAPKDSVWAKFYAKLGL
jgi:hypothetical protein